MNIDEDSEDLRIIFDARLPSGSEIDVLYKVQSSSDDRVFDDLEWRKIETLEYNENNLEEFDITPPDDHRDSDGVIKYEVDDAEFIGFNRFAVKFIFRASNTSRYPIIKNFRSIALLV